MGCRGLEPYDDSSDADVEEVQEDIGDSTVPDATDPWMDVPSDTVLDTTEDPGPDDDGDPASETVTDTGMDSDLDPDADPATDTYTDIGPDTTFDTSTDTTTDTPLDTGTDTGVDTGTDTVGDTGTDTGFDTGVDTGIDTGTDTGIDPGGEELPTLPGTTCDDAIDVTSLSTWSGSLGDYADLWSGGTGCGYASGREVWFSAGVSAGDKFTIEETSFTDVVLQNLSSCASTSCLDNADSPESMEYFNDTGSGTIVYYAVEAYSSSSTGTVTVEFTNAPPIAGYTCDDPVDVTSLSTWSGDFDDHADLWSGGTGCGFASGKDMWFTATVAAGDLLTIEETSYTDVVIERVSSCASTSCLDYTDSPESMEYLNDSGSDVTLLLVVEAYYASETGSVSLELTNTIPAAGYTCDNPVDATALSTWTGDFADYATLWSGGTGCGSATGPQVWFTASVADGHTFEIGETGTVDVVIQHVESCPSSVCLDYTDTPEILSYTNSTGSPVDVWFVVEKYASGSSGSLTMEFSNAP
jgi:hypothetical protein